ncbi:MAG TPA: BamA/TamA family outer membrane protein [Polyangia bacterium]|nr:BamA/TamA family outer membrane protein [Polyangia bacterium]
MRASWVVGRACVVLVGLLSAPARAQSGRELNFVPLVGGDSDIGVGGGFVGDWAGLEPGRPPYRWRLEASAFLSFKLRANAQGRQTVILPYQDYVLALTIPRIGPGNRVRLDVRPSFTDEILRYYGIGNASPPLAANEREASVEYRRFHPAFSVEARVHLFDAFYLSAGSTTTYNRLTVPADTRLARDQSMGAPEIRTLISSTAPHYLEILATEASWDTRDDEIVTRHGSFHALRLAVSPHGGATLPYGFERITAVARFYRTPVERWLTISWRVVGDTLIGDPPLYELARFDDTPAIGGLRAVRGVPAQRYHGKVKAFGNVELVSELYAFTIKRKQLVLGAAAFFDAGRNWTELGRSHPELDGTGIGLKYGVGGGLRLQEGRTFLLRLDIAWSPDASPVGAYFAAGQIF